MEPVRMFEVSRGWGEGVWWGVGRRSERSGSTLDEMKRRCGKWHGPSGFWGNRAGEAGRNFAWAGLCGLWISCLGVAHIARVAGWLPSIPSGLGLLAQSYEGPPALGLERGDNSRLPSGGWWLGTSPRGWQRVEGGRQTWGSRAESSWTQNGSQNGRTMARGGAMAAFRHPQGATRLCRGQRPRNLRFHFRSSLSGQAKWYATTEPVRGVHRFWLVWLGGCVPWIWRRGSALSGRVRMGWWHGSEGVALGWVSCRLSGGPRTGIRNAPTWLGDAGNWEISIFGLPPTAMFRPSVRDGLGRAPFSGCSAERSSNTFGVCGGKASGQIGGVAI
jgi:hypothetical protein